MMPVISVIQTNLNLSDRGFIMKSNSWVLPFTSVRLWKNKQDKYNVYFNKSEDYCKLLDILKMNSEN